MYQVIADSGSTKTDWLVLPGAEEARPYVVHTQGISPVHQTESAVRAVLSDELLPQLGSVGTDAPVAVAFYGSGCTPQYAPVVERALAAAFPRAGIEVQSDLLGAARALCGRSEGIACILGTGSNSALYDGRRIVQNTPALGYILGDEGSGAVLGRSFLTALLKGQLSENQRDEFLRESGLTQHDVIRHVYREPMANRWLASLAPAIWQRLGIPEVEQLVVDNFRLFFQRNIRPYRRSDLPVHFVGSIAVHFRRQLDAAARAEGFRLGTIEQSPLDGLRRYHL